MKVIRYFAVALDSIRANKLRSSLTMLGIIIGVAAVLTTMGIGSGAAASITQRIESQGTNLLSVNAGGGGGSTSSTLTMGDAEALSDISLHPALLVVVPEYTASATLTNAATDSQSQVVGTSPAYAVVRNLEMAAGRFFDEAENDVNERVLVLGNTVAADLFAVADDALGQQVRVNGEPFMVVGVLAESGSAGFGGPDSRANVPIGVAQGRLINAPRYRGDYTITGLSIQADGTRMDAAELQIEQTMRLRHMLGPDDENDFSIFNQASLLEVAGEVAQTLTVFLGSIGAISLLVGGIGIMNIMLVSVTERTREIGLRKAVGAHDRDILLQFLIESLVLATIGGLIGMGISFGLAFAVGRIPNFPFSVIIQPQALLLALGVSSASGFVFGIYPAMRATRLDPIEALRFE